MTDTTDRRKSNPEVVATLAQYLDRYRAGAHRLLDLALGAPDPASGGTIMGILGNCAETYHGVKTSDAEVTPEQLTQLANEFDGLINNLEVALEKMAELRQ